MKFSKNGYVILIDEEDKNDHGQNHETITNTNSQRIVNVGKWRMDANGISWTMQTHVPITTNDSKSCIEGENKDSRRTTSLYYHADIHLSKFQSRPRMLKGTITRDRYHNDGNVESKRGLFVRKNIFRPVIASFTAEGIGEDTLALQYKDRGFGLSNAKN